MNLIGQSIAVIGLGYVGLPLAVEFGKRYPVVGFDIKPERIAELQAGRDSTLEVPPEELAAAKRLAYSSNPEDLRTCQVFIATVPTPVDHVNRPDFTPLVKASETVGRVLKKGDVVIYESTVYPGATEERWHCLRRSTRRIPRNWRRGHPRLAQTRRRHLRRQGCAAAWCG